MAAFLADRRVAWSTRLPPVISAAIEGMHLLPVRLAPSEDGLRTLVKLTTMPYGQTVRNRALTALERIAGTIK